MSLTSINIYGFLSEKDSRCFMEQKYNKEHLVLCWFVFSDLAYYAHNLLQSE